MSTLYILGAGCSKNYSQSTHQIEGLESPLNSNFFKMAHLVIEHSAMRLDEVFMDEIYALIKKIAPLYGSDNVNLSFFDNLDLNLEEVMTLLDIEFKLFSPTAQLERTESHQLRTLKDLLARTLDHSLNGPSCSKHRTLARRMQKGDVILNFNYDLLLDNALFDLGKVTDSGYLMNFFKVNNNNVWENQIEEQSAITLFKLHGSLNWVRCGLCGSLILYRFKKQTMYGAHVFQCPRCFADDRFGIRMMIPPIQSKEYHDKNISFLWVQADRMLMRQFSRIVSIGYSFSPSDFDMASLMRRMRSKQRDLQEVYCVNPDFEAENRLKALLGINKIHHFDDLKSYLKSTD